MNPFDPVWPGIIKASLILLAVVLSGVPVSIAVFGERPRPVWAGYAPITGLLIHLLAINLFSWAFPGSAGAWLGFGAAVALGAACGVRVRWRCVRRLDRISLAGGGTLVIAVFYIALSNRTQVLFTDEPWHLPLAASMARGFFPPISPFSPDAGAAYHYGADLLAAAMMNLAGVAPWTAFYLLSPLLATVLVLSAATMAWDLGAPRTVASGIGLVAGFAGAEIPYVVLGLPRALGQLGPEPGWWSVVRQFGAPAQLEAAFWMGPVWLNTPHFALGLALLLLMAAAFNAGRGRRCLAIGFAAFGALPLGETAVFLVSLGGVAAYSLARLLAGPIALRAKTLAALGAGCAMALLGGGALTDTIFGRAGGSGARLALTGDWWGFTEFFSPGLGFNVLVGLPGLLAVAGVAAVAMRSWGIGIPAAAALGGVLLRQILDFGVSGVDARLIEIPYFLAAISLASAAGSLAGRLPPVAGRAAAGALVLLVLIPTAMPRLISAVEISRSGIDLGYPTIHDAHTRYLNPTRYANDLQEQWEVFEWMRRSLPKDARILAPDAPLTALATGLPAPMSGRDLTLYNPLPTPPYLDGLRFLTHLDLEELRVSHLLATTASEVEMDPAAVAALRDSSQFELLDERTSRSGGRLRVFKVLRGAGAPATSPGSLRALAEAGRRAGSVTAGGALSLPELQTLLLTFPRGVELIGEPTYLPRTGVGPQFRPHGNSVRPGLLVVPDALVLLQFGLDRSDAIWSGYGLRAYKVPADGWSAAIRLGTDEPALSQVAAACAASPGSSELRAVGERGDKLIVGASVMELSSAPQRLSLDGDACTGGNVAWSGAGVTPFVQIRRAGGRSVEPRIAAALAFDAGLDDGKAVINLWYRNLDNLRFEQGTELRAFKVDPSDIGPDGTKTVAWWSGPLVLAVDKQMARLEFDARRMNINDVDGGAKAVANGHYVLVLNIAGGPSGRSPARVSLTVPLLMWRVDAGTVEYKTLSGILAVEP